MGNKGTKAQPLVVIKNPDYKVFDQNDYNSFFHDPDHIICSVYDDIDQFIEKQSLKNLHHILIVQEHLQYLQKTQDHRSSQQTKQLAEYIIPIDKALNYKNQAIATTRQKIINYIKKYSVQNLNIYLYVKNFRDLVIPESQVPYVTIVSTKAYSIMNHILNQQSQKMASAKFKGLVKDLYRRKLVVVISKNYIPKKKDQKNQPKKIAADNNSKQPKDKSPKKEKLQKQQAPDLKQDHRTPESIQLLKRMEENFKSTENNFEYVFVSTIQELSDKIKSMYFEFMICLDKQNLLEVIEFKKKMPIQSKLIYFGTEADLKEGGSKETEEINKIILQKKIKQIWWISDNLEEDISPVMKKWWNAKTENQNNDKMATNVVVYLSKCQNIIRKKYIEQSLRQKINSKSADKQLKELSKKMNLTFEFKLQNIYKRLRQGLYTIIIMFDATYEQFEEIKKFIVSKIKGQPRAQVSLVELKDDGSSPDLALQKRIEACCDKKFFELKFEISPFETINCLNLSTEYHDYFTSKMGMKVNILEAQMNERNQIVSIIKKQRKLYKMMENYFPKIAVQKGTDQGLKGNNKNTEKRKIQLSTTFENFLIICSFQDYLRYIFPFLTLANFYDKQKHIYEQPSVQTLENIMSYIKRIKVIIHGDIEQKGQETDGNISVNQFLKIHQNPSEVTNYIKRAIFEFLDIPNNEKSNSSKKKEVEKSPQEKAQQLELKKLIQRIERQVYRPLKNQKGEFVKNNQNEIRKQIVFPNIQFVHYRLSQIESYINFLKYNKLSFSSFPKGSLKQFHQANKKIENIMASKSFSLEATFVSSNDLLKQVFQQKNIEVTSKHQMQFIKFKNQIEISSFESYIKKYTGLWKLNYELMRKIADSPARWELINENLRILKADVIRAFKKCKNYQLLKVSTAQFKSFYIDRIEKCETLLDLQIEAIYIYSLPHGMSEVINAIFDETARSTLSLQIFCSFLCLLFLNFFSFESRTLNKVSTVIYVEQEKVKNFYDYVKQNEIAFNKNMLHLINNDSETQNDKNHCIFVEYDNVPLTKKSSLSALLSIEKFAFYKESAEYLLAPFTKLRLKKKEIIKQKYRLYFEIVQQNDSNLFLKEIFSLNNINDIALFQALDANISLREKYFNLNQLKQGETQQLPDQPFNFSKQVKNSSKNLEIIQGLSWKQKPTNEAEIEKSMKNNKTKQDKINKLKKKAQANESASLYKQAQEIALTEEKKNVRLSIKLTLSYMKMIQCLNRNDFFSAEKYLSTVYTATLNQMNDNQEENNKFALVKEQFELQKLKIQRAMIHSKMRQYSKAINELDSLLEYMRSEKIQDKEDWLKGIIFQMISKIQYAKKMKDLEIQKIIPSKKWTIIMQDSSQAATTLHTRKITGNAKRKNPQFKKFKQLIEIDSQLFNQQENFQNNPLKSKFIQKPRSWKVSFNEDNQTFIMKSKDKPKQNIELYDVFSKTTNAKDTQNSLNTSISIPQPTKFSMINSFFKQIGAKQVRTLKIFHIYMKFWYRILNTVRKEDTDDDSIRQMKKLFSIPQAYILQKYWPYFISQYLKFSKILNQTKQKQKSHDRSHDFLFWLQNQSNEQEINKLRLQLLDELYFRLKTEQIQVRKNKSSSWIDMELEAKSSCRMKWSVFQFENKMIVVDTNRKWKQKIAPGKTSSKVFYRSDNEVLQNVKAKQDKN